MGAGKTTLAKKIAKQLKIPLLDVDSAIEKNLNLSISSIFTDFGEQHFRALERNFIQNIHPDFQGVISVGGGLPCYKNNMDLLLNLGKVFYLKRSPKELAQRLKQGNNQRPLIAEMKEDELVLFIQNKLDEREGFYNQADFVLERNEQNVQRIVDLTQSN